jgi:hypothetical protein
VPYEAGIRGKRDTELEPGSKAAWDGMKDRVPEEHVVGPQALALTPFWALKDQLGRPDLGPQHTVPSAAEDFLCHLKRPGWSLGWNGQFDRLGRFGQLMLILASFSP